VKTVSHFLPGYFRAKSYLIYSLIMMAFICCAEGEPAIKTDEATDIRWTKIDDIENIIEDCPETIFPMDILPLKKYIRYSSNYRTEH